MDEFGARVRPRRFARSPRLARAGSGRRRPAPSQLRLPRGARPPSSILPRPGSTFAHSTTLAIPLAPATPATLRGEWMISTRLERPSRAHGLAGVTSPRASPTAPSPSTTRRVHRRRNRPLYSPEVSALRLHDAAAERRAPQGERGGVHTKEYYGSRRRSARRRPTDGWPGEERVTGNDVSPVRCFWIPSGARDMNDVMRARRFSRLLAPLVMFAQKAAKSPVR